MNPENKREKQRRAADVLSTIVVDCALETANRTIAELLSILKALMDAQQDHNLSRLEGATPSDKAVRLEKLVAAQALAKQVIAKVESHL